MGFQMHSTMASLGPHSHQDKPSYGICDIEVSLQNKEAVWGGASKCLTVVEVRSELTYCFVRPFIRWPWRRKGWEGSQHLFLPPTEQIDRFSRFQNRSKTVNRTHGQCRRKIRKDRSQPFPKVSNILQLSQHFSWCKLRCSQATLKQHSFSENTMGSGD
jgi:hypothetical protein